MHSLRGVIPITIVNFVVESTFTQTSQTRYVLTLKYIFFRSNESIQRIKSEIKLQQDLQEKYEMEYNETEKTLKTIIQVLFNIYISLRELGIKPQNIPRDMENGERMIGLLHAELKKIVDFDDARREEEVVVEKEVVEGEKEEELVQEKPEEPVYYPDEMLLPPTYNIILRRTPVLPEQIGTPAPVGKLGECFGTHLVVEI